jgi:hypothetical protein
MKLFRRPAAGIRHIFAGSIIGALTSPDVSSNEWLMCGIRHGNASDSSCHALRSMESFVSTAKKLLAAD